MARRVAWRRWLTTDSRFARNVVQVARANVLAQALPLLAAPLLSRLYSPADFGALALFASALSMGLAVATGRFDWSVPNARSARPAAALLALGALVLLATTTGLCLALAWGGLSGWALLPGMLRELGWASVLLPLALLGGGAQQLLAAWHVRGAELSVVGRAKVTQSAANVLSSLVAAPWLGVGQGVWGLLAGVMAGAWVGLGTLWQGASGLYAALASLTWRRLAASGRRFAAEAAWSTLVSALNAASFAVVPLLLARHFSAAEVGFYALMQRVALGPVALVGAAVSQSFWAESARLVRQDPSALKSLYRRSTGRLVWLAVPLAVLVLAGPLYVGPLFGDAQWAAAGWVLAACTPMLVGQVVVSPLSHLVVHGRQHWQAWWDAVRVAALVVTIEGLGRAGATLPQVVLGLSVVMGLMYGVLFRLNLRALSRT